MTARPGLFASLRGESDPRRALKRWLLARDEASANFRLMLVAVLLGVVWLGAILVERPAVDLGPFGEQTGFLAVLLRPFIIVFLAAFKLSVLRHLALPLIMLGLGVRDGGKYVDDLFELHDEGLAREYVLAALFGLNYPTLEIKDGQVTEASKKTTLYKIGGPGFIKVHLGNAALFERADGQPTIYQATYRQFVHGFERLREVLDLRDQLRPLGDMEGYTNDGVSIKATAGQVIFRVGRSALHSVTPPAAPGRKSGPPGLAVTNPYPVDEQSLRRVVYGRTIGADFRSAAWTESVAAAAAASIRKHIRDHLLDDLIAQRSGEASQPPVVGGGEAVAMAAVKDQPENTRQALKESFYNAREIQKFRERGVDLIWIGVGTLDTPPEIAQEQINAWQNEMEAEKRHQQPEPERLKGRGAQMTEFIRTIGEWVRGKFVRDGRPTPADVLKLYHLQLRELRQSVGSGLPDRTDEALGVIARLAGPQVIGEEKPEAAAP